jgi:magnesium transporter
MHLPAGGGSMLTILIRGGEPDRAEATAWVHATAPDAEERARLVVGHGVPASFIDHALDPDEPARLDREDGIHLVVLRVPHAMGAGADVPYRTMPLGIILTSEGLVTVAPHPTPVVEAVAAHPRLSLADREQLLLLLLQEAAKQYLDHLRGINLAIEEVEDRLQRALQNREVMELLRFQKSLTYFTIGLQSNDLLLQRLQRSPLFNQPEDQELLDDVLTEVAQANTIAATSSHILGEMMDAFASIISNNLNVVMKFLTAFTVILAIPTLIASIYGMNVGLPLAHSPMAFMGISLVSGLLVLAVGLLFWRRNWF